MVSLRRWTARLLLLFLAACASGGGDTAELSQRRLPTVTPDPTSGPPEPSAPAPTVPALTVVPSPTTPPPTPSPEPIISEEGVLTPPMVKLQLEPERYAALGDPHAPITVVEFSDFGCPSCRHFELFTFKELKERYIDTGKIFYVYKDFPITSQQGALAAQAAECAGDQGHYWEMHHELFVQAQSWDTTAEGAREQFRLYAAKIGIDAAALESCVAEGRYADEVDRDAEEAFRIGLNATPSFLIDRKLLLGAQPFEVFEEVLERELRERE